MAFLQLAGAVRPPLWDTFRSRLSPAGISYKRAVLTAHLANTLGNPSTRQGSEPAATPWVLSQSWGT